MAPTPLPPSGFNPTPVDLKAIRRTIDVSTFSTTGSDTSKFMGAIKYACKEPGTLLYLPWHGKPFKIEDELRFEHPNANDFINVSMVFDPIWCAVDFYGKPGQSCFRTIGLKQSTWTDVMIRTFGDDLRGFTEAGTDKVGSSGMNLWERCRVQTWQGARTTGFLIGEGGDDYSASVWKNCQYYGDNPSRQYKQWDANHLVETNKLGHRGFVFNGPNNCYQRLQDCTACGAKIGVTQLYGDTHKQEGPSGGSGLIVDNFGTTGVNLIFQTNGGFDFWARGGRHELSGSLLSHGTPGGYQGAGTDKFPVVVLRDMMVDDLRPFSGAASDTFEPGAVLSLKSCARYLLDGVAFHQFDLGEKLDDHKAVLLAHNRDNVNSELVFSMCQLEFNPHNARRVAGSWEVVNNGAVKQLGSVPV